MKTVGNRELKNRLSRYLNMVGKGETLTVTKRGKAVARIVPLGPEEEEKPKTVEDVLIRLEAEGHLRRAKRSFKGRRFKPIHTKGKPASQMILEDRE
jgi:prevent-host-death family protein